MLGMWQTANSLRQGWYEAGTTYSGKQKHYNDFLNLPPHPI